MQLSLFEDIPSEEEHKEVTTLHCRKCDTHKPLSSFNYVTVQYETEKRTPGTRGVAGTARYCNECRVEYRTKKAIAEKNAGPRPLGAYNCDCCGTLLPPGSVMLDHDHDTAEFRGWLCRSCNVGLGQLGDDIEGLTRAIKYLEKHNERQS